MLIRANDILGQEYKPFPDDFEIFNEDEMPNNGDVVFILSHYLTSLEKLRCNNIEFERKKLRWFWKIDDKISEYQTNNPRIR